jgi:hypothetical protein
MDIPCLLLKNTFPQIVTHYERVVNDLYYPVVWDDEGYKREKQ